MNKKNWRKLALAFSSFLFIIWWALGTGATLAWFSDVETVRNEFRIGLLDLEVDYKNDIILEYTPLKGATEVFYDEALYEPGYTQVVYLRIANQGDVDFDYQVAVNVHKVVKGVDAWGKEIYLPNYLRYGAVFARTEAELNETLKDRLSAKAHATNEWDTLGTWAEASPYTFHAGEDYHYGALIIHMPEDVGNDANYRGFTQPSVELGVTVSAQQHTGTND